MNRSDTTATIDRRDLVACLTAGVSEFGRDAILEAAARMTQGLTVVPLQPAECGLALMQWRDAIMHQRFFLGEVPMARAAVALVNPRGERAEGAAVVMADDAELAQAMAVLDAVVSQRWPGAEEVDALLERGARVRERVRTVRQAGLKRTRVEFDLLSHAETTGGAEA